MDIAYDHIQEEVNSPEEATKKEGEKQRQGTLNTEFQEAYKSFSASPWGARLGGFFNDVKKQGETYYEGARQEASTAGGEALKGFTDLKTTLVSRARSISTTQKSSTNPTVEGTSKGLGEDALSDSANKERSESEALRESEGLISRFRTEATKRLKEIEKAEDAADEALLKFGTNIRNFLRDAVTIAPPTEEKNKDGTQKVLFESKDQDGKRVIHTTRFDAQLHAIHSSFDSFAKDPASPEYEKWKSDFDVEKKTDDIATDLEKYEELRRAMEKLVPEKVEYAQFWTRYYFLRMVVETEEQRRREMLKGAALTPTENIAWDDDSDTDSQPSTPQPPPTLPAKSLTQQTHSSTTTIHPIPSPSPSSSTTIQNPNPNTNNPNLNPNNLNLDSNSTATLKPHDAPPRRSQDQHSQADSDASYDLISGATSRAPGSPDQDQEREFGNVNGGKGDEDEEEPDWE